MPKTLPADPDHDRISTLEERELDSEWQRVERHVLEARSAEATTWLTQTFDVLRSEHLDELKTGQLSRRTDYGPRQTSASERMEMTILLDALKNPDDYSRGERRRILTGIVKNHHGPEAGPRIASILGHKRLHPSISLGELSAFASVVARSKIEPQKAMTLAAQGLNSTVPKLSQMLDKLDSVTGHELLPTVSGRRTGHLTTRARNLAGLAHIAMLLYERITESGDEDQEVIFTALVTEYLRLAKASGASDLILSNDAVPF